ncbi:MAG: phosphotransferase family protein [Acidimicrobiales bacterium]
MEGRAVEGIDEGRVTAWFVANVEGAEAPLRFELVAGGRSNLTFRVTDGAGHDYVLRRPPTSHVLPTAHDMGREHRVVSALAPTPVPVPPVLGYCADPEVTGQPFYVMAFVGGHVLRTAEASATELDQGGRAAAGASLVDVLADLHAVDIDEVGLSGLGRQDGYIERQLRRWYGQFRQSAGLLGRPVPAVDEVHDRLSGRIPPQGRATIVHGDYRLDNTMLDDGGRVVAVLDWEICTLGDPLADVGLLNVYWNEPGDARPTLTAPTMTPGFASREEMMARYAKRSGRDLSELGYYVAFGYWKLACILEGVQARYAGGAMGGDRTGVELFTEQVDGLAEAALDAAAAL